MSAFQKETVLSVKHWTDSLFSFTATRDPGFRFQNGQFAMIGLEVEGRPLVRAYSMASANHEDALEFFSIKVADGPLTSRLQKIKEGDIILVGRKPTGTLITANLIPGKRLLLLRPVPASRRSPASSRIPTSYETIRARSFSPMAAARSPNWPMANASWKSFDRTSCSARCSPTS